MLSMETVQNLANAAIGLTTEQVAAAIAASKNAAKLGDSAQLAAWICSLNQQ